MEKKCITENENLIEIKGVSKIYETKGAFLGQKVDPVAALRNVSLNIKKGEIVGLVGESGSGKSTLGNCILKLLDINCGEILYGGKNIKDFSKEEEKKFREKTGLIFQNPYSSLNPKMKIKEILTEPLVVHNIQNEKKRIVMLNNIVKLTGLNADDLDRYPHEFSGGQRQRIAIARALIL